MPARNRKIAAMQRVFLFFDAEQFAKGGDVQVVENSSCVGHSKHFPFRLP